MPQYVAGVTATTNSTTGTADVFMELKATSSVTIQLKRVRVSFGSSNQSAGPTSYALAQIYRYTTTSTTTPTTLTFPASTSAAGASSGSFWTSRSAVAVNSTLASLKVKNGTTAYTLGTGSVQLVDQFPVYGLMMWEWLARDNEDYIESGVNNCIAIALSAQAVSQVYSVLCDWVE